MSEKKRIYVRESIKRGDTKADRMAAARAAGYVGAGLSGRVDELMCEAELETQIAEARTRLRNNLRADTEVSPEFVLAGFKALATNSDSDTARANALTQLAKILGMFERDNAQKHGVQARLADLTPAVLARLEARLLDLAALSAPNPNAQERVGATIEHEPIPAQGLDPERATTARTEREDMQGDIPAPSHPAPGTH